ncbi:MAG: P1 family peptidase, partial [Alphaproteobacteria bacterium]|nr:P1 family peptidase [Alphaproteobacteria bacterium]
RAGGQRPIGWAGAGACDAAAEDFALGNAGAGYAATAGTLKGGLGSASACTEDGIAVGALAAVNAMGRVTYRGSPRFYAGEFELAGELGEQQRFPAPMDDGEAELPPAEPGANTTLAVVATNVALDQGGAKRLAIMAQDGLARAIRPVHTPFDGDIVFALSTGRGEAMSDPRRMARLGHLASACVARAVMRGVFEADSLGIAKSYCALHGGALRG